MSNSPFENYKITYLKKNPNADPPQCWKSFQKRIVQKGGYNIGFNLFKKSINGGKGKDIDSWKYYENILLKGGGPCDKIGSPVLFNEDNTLYFSILINKNDKKCTLLKYNIPYSGNTNKLLNDNSQWSWPIETTCENVLVIPGTKVYDANGSQIKINLDKISYLKDNLDQRKKQGPALVEPSVKNDLHIYFIDNQNQNTILEQLSRPEILKYLCEENTCFKKQSLIPANIFSKVKCPVITPEQVKPPGSEPVKLPEVDNTDSIQSQEAITTDQNPFDNLKPTLGNLENIKYDKELNPLQTGLNIDNSPTMIQDQTVLSRDETKNIGSLTQDIESETNPESESKKQDGENFKTLSVNQYKDYGDQQCSSKNAEECLVCNELKGDELTVYQRDLIPSGDKIAKILGQVKKTPYQKTTLNQANLNIQPSSNGTPIFCYTDQSNTKHFKRLYPKRIRVEQKDWSTIPREGYTPPDFTLGAKSISILDMSSSCCGIKDSYNYLSKDCISDINSEVEPDEYNLVKTCPNFKETGQSRYGSIINYGQESTNKSGVNDPNIGRPLNPNGRTGLAGKGILAKWGPNYEALTMLVRKNNTTGEDEKSRSEPNNWEIKLEYNINNKSLTVPAASIANNDNQETSLLVAQSEFLEHLVELEPDKLITIVDPNSAKGYNQKNGLSNRVNLMKDGNYTSLLKGADKIFSGRDTLSEIYIAIEDIVRKGFSLDGGCVDLLFTGCISDNRNTDNAWVEGAVYLFNISTKPYLVEEEYWKWIQDIANTEKKSTTENSFSWFNLDNAGNGKQLDWEGQQLTCCEGDGLSFVALADGYLKGLDIEEANEREAIKKIEMENESDSKKIGEIVNNIKQSYAEVVSQRSLLEQKERDLTQHINELKSLGLDVISKEKGLKFNKYLELLNCNQDEGLKDEVICSDPKNSVKLINDDWINQEYASEHSDLFSDDNVSQVSTSQISAPLEQNFQSSLDNTTDFNVPLVNKPVGVAKLPSVTEPVSVTNVPSVTEPVGVAKLPSVTEPVSVTNVPSVTEPFGVAKLPSVTEPVSVAKLPSVTEPVNVAKLPSVTEPVSVPEMTKQVSQTNTKEIESLGGSMDDDISSYLFTE